jgi:zinc resistance-associated protein
MWKPILAGTAALAIAGSSLVYAQQRFGGADRDADRGPPDRAQSGQPSPEDRAAFTEARIAALHAGLQLTPEQDRAWPAFETALRDLVKNRRERLEALHNQQPTADPTERLKRRGDALASAGAALQRLAEAQGPLYASLDEGQKRRFAMLAQRLSPGFAMGGGMGGPGMMERGGMMGMGRHGMMGRDGMMGRPGMGDYGMGRHGMRDDRGDDWRRHEHWREHHGYRGERRSDADGDRDRRGWRDERGWRDDRGMDGRGMRDWRDERGREGRGPEGRGPDGRSMGRMGGEERL